MLCCSSHQHQFCTVILAGSTNLIYIRHRHTIISLSQHTWCGLSFRVFCLPDFIDALNPLQFSENPQIFFKKAEKEMQLVSVGNRMSLVHFWTYARSPTLVLAIYYITELWSEQTHKQQLIYQNLQKVRPRKTFSLRTNNLSIFFHTRDGIPSFLPLTFSLSIQQQIYQRIFICFHIRVKFCRN